MLNGIPPRYPVVHLRSATETTNFLAPSLPLSPSKERRFHGGIWFRL